ncbi:MAG: hypothetical protein Ta2D_11800 [Rickettsiales bacterium]|nr:MAG: hypothetical protein Ta2D_11800 [Rickettsiales bacterium]
MIYLLLNFIILSLPAFLIKGKNKKQNLLFSAIISLFHIAELLSDAFFSAPINEDFLYFILNIGAVKFMITTKFIHIYFCFLLFFVFWRIFYIIFSKEKWQFVKFKKYIAIAVLIWGTYTLGIYLSNPAYSLLLCDKFI